MRIKMKQLTVLKTILFVKLFLMICVLNPVQCEKLQWSKNRPDFFSNCPPKCICEPNQPTPNQDLKITCTNLDAIPQVLPPFVKILILKNNDLFKINSGVLSSYTRLETLELSGNKISTLSEKPFDRLNQLTNLKLDHNNLNSLDPESFHGLTKLQRLDLSYNNIEFIPDQLFSQCLNLQNLDLSHNRLTNLPDKIFQNVQFLQVIYKIYFKKNRIIHFDFHI